jgi:phosphoserine phosphatase
VSEDRLEVLGEEYFHEHLRNRIRPVGFDLVERAKLQGRRVVLLSDNLDVIVRHVADHVGADLWVANHLEVRNGRATGRLSDPVLTRPGGRWLREWADAHGLSLGQSCGYGSSESDAVLLSAIGLPCAIHPDRALRRMARDLDWPVVEA